jgi:hypothetical protein
MLLYCGKLGKCYFSDVMNMVEKHFTYEYDDSNDIGSVSILIDHLKQCTNHFIVYFPYDDEDPYDMDEVKERELQRLEFKENCDRRINTIRRDAAIKIQKMYRGWIFRKNHVWNPHTPIGKLFCKKDFNELLRG